MQQPDEKEIAKRKSLLEQVAETDWAPIKRYLDGMLDAHKASILQIQSDASTNFVRGQIAAITFFLDLPSMAQNELSMLYTPKGEQDTSHKEGL